MKLPEVLKYTEKDKINALSYYNDDIIEYIKKYNNEEYLHWNKLQYKKGLPVEPKYLWILMKIDRKLHYRDLKFHNWIFKYYINDTIQDYLNELDELKFIKIPNELKISQISDKYKIDTLIEESIASSQIEGATTSKKMAKELIKKGKKPKNKDELMVYNNYIAMKHISKIKDDNFTIEEILNIHKIITKDLMENKGYEGKFRDNNEITIRNVRDNTLLYTPPNYELIEVLMKELCKFANNDYDNIHPIIKGIIIHFLIGYIHPFIDGNGRTARALFYWYMLKKGYSYFEYLKVSEIINQSKGQYRDAYLYVESEKCDEYEGDLTYFIIYLLKCIKKSVDEFKSSLEQKINENIEKIRGLNENLNLRQQDILSEIIANPKRILTIKYVMNTYGVAYATARSDLNILVELGALQKKKVGKEFIYISNLISPNFFE